MRLAGELRDHVINENQTESRDRWKQIKFWILKF